MSSGAARLRVPCTVLSVDSPKRREFLIEGVPKQRLENVLGHGSYGTVVKAIYKGKQVAMKIIDNLDVQKMSTIANEANILGWQHENIIQIFKIDTGPKEAVIIMERFPGQCLQHIIERRKLPLYHAIRTALDITKGLAYCHERKLLHLDIKPRNVLVAIQTNGINNVVTYQCKLCDFGSSMFISNMTSTHSAKGTVRYMAPELLKNEKPTARADIYSLGVTIWQLKSGRDPYFWIDENEAVIYKVVKENLRPDHEHSFRIKHFLSCRPINKCLCEQFGSNISNHRTDSSRTKNKRSDRTGRSISPVYDQKRFKPRSIESKFDALLKHTSSRSPMKANCSDYQRENKSPVNKLVLSPCHSRPHKQLANVTIQINSMGVDENFAFDDAFREKKSTKSEKDILTEYEALYRDCWNTNLSKRPDAVAVIDRLNSLLKCF